MRSNDEKLPTILVLAALGAALLGALLALTAGHLWDNDGAGGALVLAVPVGVSGLPLVSRSPSTAQRLRITAAVALCLFILVAIMSVGLYFGPALAMMFLSALVARLLPEWRRTPIVP